MVKINIKSLICILLCLIIQIHAFASIISDSDGSAFVAKSEFEALKENFANQIVSYNNSIDKKIDGAIASYLAGVRIVQRQKFNGFVEVSGSKPVIYGRQSNYEGIDSQMWNDLTCNMSVFGTAAGTAASYIPFYANSDAGYTDGRYSYWCLKVQAAKSPYKKMKGYQFDSKGVINKIYNDDQLAITIADTECVDTWGRDMGVLAHVAKSSFTSQTLETGTLYVNRLTMPDNRWSQSNGAGTSAQVTNNFSQFLYDVDNDEKYTGTGPTGNGYATKEDSGIYNISNTFYAEHVQNDEVKNYINTYNYLNSIIYAYPENAKKIEVFADPVSTYDVSNRGRRWQLAMYTGGSDSSLLSTLSGYSWFSSKGGNTIKHRYGLYVPKLKIKNDTTINDLKPVYQATDDTEKRFNNLNQFRNGYMSYLDKNGNKCYPYFYGGIPLFNMDNLTEKVTFKIRVDATTSGISKIRLWVKEGEFPNASYNPDASAWKATDPMTEQSHNEDLVEGLKVKDTKSTKKYIDIDAGKVVTVEVEDPKTKTPYFLRFSELNSSGTATNQGGKIVSLTDFIAYTS